MNWIGLLSSLCFSTLWADVPSSAMVSDAELKVLSNLPIKKEGGAPSLKKGDWRLDGIIFISESKWTVWLNGQRYTSQSLPEDVLLSNITATSLDIRREGMPVRQLQLGQVVKLDA